MKKINNSRILTFVMTILIIFSITVMPIRALALENSVVPRVITIDSIECKNMSGKFEVVLDNSDGYVPRKLYVLGNKTGGGANAEIVITGQGIFAGTTTVDINGSTQEINLYTLTSNVTELRYECTIKESGVYNLIFWVTE